jgi:hypothetical protein
MHYKKIARLLMLLTLSTLLAACGGLSTEQKTAASEAMSALRKLESSAQVGVSYMQYGPLLIDARAKVNETSAKLPDGELKTELKSAMYAYERAGSLWTKTLQWGDYSLGNIDTSILTYDDRAKFALPPDGAVSRSEAMSAMWETGSKHIARASNLLEK